MLCKDVCKACHKSHGVKWNKRNDGLWDDQAIASCCISKGAGLVLSINADPPSWCEFVLEHMVSIDEEQSAILFLERSL
jgi:hypothetical protein